MKLFIIQGRRRKLTNENWTRRGGKKRRKGKVSSFLTIVRYCNTRNKTIYVLSTNNLQLSSKKIVMLNYVSIQYYGTVEH